jgi:hypothetical protein
MQHGSPIFYLGYLLVQISKTKLLYTILYFKNQIECQNSNWWNLSITVQLYQTEILNHNLDTPNNQTLENVSSRFNRLHYQVRFFQYWNDYKVFSANNLKPHQILKYVPQTRTSSRIIIKLHKNETVLLINFFFTFKLKTIWHKHLSDIILNGYKHKRKKN